MTYAFIARGANAASRRHLQQLDRLAKPPLDDLCGPVGRAIVDNDDFEIPAFLTQGAFHRLADQACPVPCWDHDGKTTVAHAAFLVGSVETSTARNSPTDAASEFPRVQASIQGRDEAPSWENGIHDGAGPVSNR